MASNPYSPPKSKIDGRYNDRPRWFGFVITYIAAFLSVMALTLLFNVSYAGIEVLGFIDLPSLTIRTMGLSVAPGIVGLFIAKKHWLLLAGTGALLGPVLLVLIVGPFLLLV